jgi:hypothetical protein
LTLGGSSTAHIYTKTIHRTTKLSNWEECGPCPVFATVALAFALQLRKKHGNTTFTVAEECYTICTLTEIDYKEQAAAVLHLAGNTGKKD